MHGILLPAADSIARRGDDPHEPTLETALTTELIQAGRCAEQGILNCILRFRCRAAIPPPRSEQTLTVATRDLVERSWVTGAHQGHQSARATYVVREHARSYGGSGH